MHVHVRVCVLVSCIRGVRDLCVREVCVNLGGHTAERRRFFSFSSYISEITHAYVRITYAYVYMYGLAIISRLLKNIRLFCRI